MEEIILPKEAIKKVASYELKAIKEAKDSLHKLMSVAPCLFELEKDIRRRVSESIWNDHQSLISEEWECFKDTKEYKIAVKLYEANKFKTLRDAIDFVL